MILVSSEMAETLPTLPRDIQVSGNITHFPVVYPDLSTLSIPYLYDTHLFTEPG